MILTSLLTTLAAAQISPRNSWDLYHDARLVEAADGDHRDAATTYQQLVRDLIPRQAKLGAQDPNQMAPFRGDVYLSLGRSRYLMGDIARAREALMEGIRTNTCPDQCNAFLSELELEQNAVREVPVHWAFDSPDHGFFHPWVYARNKGTLRIHKAEGSDNAALVWDTIIDDRQGDMLVVAFDEPSPAPRSIRLKMQSTTVAAQVAFHVVDDLGNRFQPRDGPQPVPALKVVQIDLRLTEMVPLDPASGPLDPARISRFEVLDVSASAMATPGPNALYLDDFEVR